MTKGVRLSDKSFNKSDAHEGGREGGRSKTMEGFVHPVHDYCLTGVHVTFLDESGQPRPRARKAGEQSRNEFSGGTSKTRKCSVRTRDAAKGVPQNIPTGDLR